MKIPIIDASEYFRGLLLLIRKDHRITDVESLLMKRIGKTLGFEREFCENAIQEILENSYIKDTPPVFSMNVLAMKFIKDSLTLALSDKEAHAAEVEWLRATAEKNGLDIEWFLHELKNARMRKDDTAHLEVDDLTMQHS